MSETEGNAARFRMPHTLTLLFGMMVAALVATRLVPRGRFETEITETGREVVRPGTFQLLPDPEPLGLWDLFTAVPRAFADAQDIIFFLFIVGGVLAIIRATGTIDALLSRFLERSGRPATLIYGGVFAFALASSVMGASGEYIPFVLILIAACRAMRLDAMTAVGVIVAGYGIGYGVAAFNPYTVVVAQGIAGIPTYSGWEVRLALLVPFVWVGAHHVRGYSRRILDDPSAGLMAGIEPPEAAVPPRDQTVLRPAHWIVLGGFVVGLGIAVWGIATRGWYLTELGAVFLIIGLGAAVAGGIGADLAARRFVSGAAELTETALLVGVARGIALVMEDGQILHTVVNALSLPLSEVGPSAAAVGMVGIQAVLNFFVPSGSGQAFVTMPLMAPLADLVGVSRQVAVMAFQFGDGFANMVVPTNPVLMGILGMAGIPYDRWLRFCLPLFLKLMAFGAIVLGGAVALGW